MKVKTLLIAGLILVLMAGLLGSAGLAAAPPERIDVLIGFHEAPGGSEQALVRGGGGEIYRRFTVVNVIAARMTPQAAGALALNPRVVYVELDGPVYAVEQAVPWGIDRVFGGETYPFATWTASKGSGIGVAVLDTGIDVDHPDLNVVGGRRFYMVSTGPPQNRLREDDNYDDVYGHGTHVAGTVAALDNDFGVVGVAPLVSLYAVKVLDDTGSGSVSAIVAGIEWAVNNGIPVLNMSLGSTTHSETLQDACDNAYAAGHLVVAAAGNEGEGTDTVIYPAKYESVIAVAASDISDARASFSSTGPAVELIAPGADVLSTIPWTDENSLTVEGVSYQANYIENAARTDASGVTGLLVDGGLATTTNPDWSGKAVLVERGEISFYDKVMNVQNSGGVAVVIYNNEPGNFYGTLGDGNSSDIPAISLSQEDGQWLVANKLGVDGTVVSLYDPNTPGYGRSSGTSMASPHAAGVAALVWAADPGLTNVQVRAILQQTAEGLGLPATHQGYGLVRADSAVKAVEPPMTYTITATAGEGGTTEPSGDVIVSEGESQTFTITPYTGYEISDVLVDNVSVEAVSSYTFENVTADHTIQATFASLPTYTITATAGEGGTIEPSGEVIVNEGDGQTFTITPYTGYEISDVLVDSVSVGAVSSYTFENVTADHTIHATFAEATAATDARVESITYATRGGRYNNKHLDITLLLLDNLGNPVANASVAATLRHDAGSTWDFQGTTDSNGTVTFTLVNHGTGCYWTEVTAVVASGLEWDSVTPDNSYCK